MNLSKAKSFTKVGDSDIVLDANKSVIGIIKNIAPQHPSNPIPFVNSHQVHSEARKHGVTP